MGKEIVTSAAANKMLRQLQDDKAYLLSLEDDSATYIKVSGYEDERPQYDYSATREEISKIDLQILLIKHAINLFNCTTQLPNQGCTIDSGLIKMAQLNKEKDRLDVMRKRLPVARRQNRYGDSSNLVEYICTNYDIEQAQADYKMICDEIKNIQMDIDYVNQTKKFEIETI